MQQEPPLLIEGDADRFDHRSGNEDYQQANDLFRLMDAAARARLIGNLINALRDVPREIQHRQINHFLQADTAYGKGITEGLGIDPEGLTT